MNENVQAEAISESAPQAEVQQQPVEAPQQEKMVPQSEVNRLVGSAKQKGYDKAREEFHVEQPAAQPYAQQQNVQMQQGMQAPQQANPMQQMNMDPQAQMRELARQAAQEAQQQYLQEQQQLLQQQQQRQLYEDLAAKAKDAKAQYNDFDETMQAVGYLDSMPEIQQAVAGFDNAGHVLYDLAKNPTKAADILKLAERDPQIAYSQLQRLSDSIKQNRNAQNTAKAPEPLSQINPSNVGADSGHMSVRDFKKLYRG